MIWIKIAFGVIFGIFMYLSYGSMHKRVQTNIKTTEEQKQYNASTTKLKHQVVATMTNLKSTLEGIHDVNTAKSAVDSLQQVARELKSYLDVMKDLSIDDAHQIRQYILDFVPHLKQPLIKIQQLRNASSIIDAPIQKIDASLMYFKVMK